MNFFRSRAAAGALSLLTGVAALLVSTATSRAAPSLVVDVATGAVLHAEQATRPWYPASLTKLMTVYVALRAVHEGRLTLQTPLVVSSRAMRMAPSKMGFKPGTEVTLENALKMIMVKSANDVSVTIAEGVSGSVEKFADEMNQVAAALGMRQSHFVNPNGLHHDAHVSSAQDMAILARALLIHFPQHQSLYGIGALKLGSQIIPTHNGLLGRYPGADGMKTGFVCASGFNVVASATRGGRRIVTVVMGSPNAKSRTLKAMALFEQGFAAGNFGRTTLAQLPPSGIAEPPNLRSQICGPGRNRDAVEDYGVSVAGLQNPGTNFDEGSPAAFFQQQRAASNPALVALATGQLGPRPVFEPEPVYIGRAPGWTGTARAALSDGSPAAGAPAAPRTAHTPTQANPHKPLPPVAAKPAGRNTKKAAKATGTAAAKKQAPAKPAAAKQPAKKQQAAKPDAKAKTQGGQKPKPQASATASPVR
ncbi:MAG: D-alanyl-D-alanine carboxypeptidase family protein [Beijerinckiaceae bacterium]